MTFPAGTYPFRQVKSKAVTLSCALTEGTADVIMIVYLKTNALVFSDFLGCGDLRILYLSKRERK